MFLQEEIKALPLIAQLHSKAEMHWTLLAAGFDRHTVFVRDVLVANFPTRESFINDLGDIETAIQAVPGRLEELAKRADPFAGLKRERQITSNEDFAVMITSLVRYFMPMVLLQLSPPVNDQYLGAMQVKDFVGEERFPFIKEFLSNHLRRESFKADLEQLDNPTMARMVACVQSACDDPNYLKIIRPLVERTPSQELPDGFKTKWTVRAIMVAVLLALGRMTEAQTSRTEGEQQAENQSGLGTVANDAVSS